MRKRHWHLALIAGLFLLAVLTVLAEPDALQQNIDEIAAKIRGWDRTAKLAIAVNILVVVFGALVAGFQKLDKSWSKNTCLALGVLIATLSGVNNVIFPKDLNALRLSVLDGEQVLRDMRIIREELSRTNAENRGALQEEFRKRLDKISEIERKALAARVHEPRAATVYAAEQGLPFRIPDDPNSYYVVGVGADASLSAARQKSYDQAVDRMCDQLKSVTATQQQARSVSYYRAIVLASAAVANTSFTYDASARTYSYYALLRLNRAYGNVALLQKLSPAERVEGQARLPDGASRPGSLNLSVRAANPKDGNFNFTFKYAPTRTGDVSLQLDQVEVIEDGSIGSTRWLFEVFVNDKSVARLPERRYDDSTATRLVRFGPEERIHLRTPPGATIRVVGYKPKDLKY